MAGAVGTQRPVIGVTTSAHGGRLLWLFNALAVRRAGGCPVRLTSRRAGDAGRLDGLIIGGGDDLDARLYGGDVHLGVRIDPERDALEYRMLAQARARDLPVLGICRGAQLLNVFLGGTLHGDIYAAYANLPRQRALLPRKRIHVLPGTRLHAVLGLSRVRVNSLHHQAIDRVAAPLAVAACDRHGIIQAVDIEAGTFTLGVQWHPEFLVFNRPQQRLFRALVRAARDHRRPTGAEPDPQSDARPARGVIRSAAAGADPSAARRRWPCGTSAWRRRRRAASPPLSGTSGR